MIEKATGRTALKVDNALRAGTARHGFLLAQNAPLIYNIRAGWLLASA